MNLMGMTAVELGKAIKDGQVSVVEATQACLDSIEACEKDYNSFVTVDREGALAQAEEVQMQQTILPVSVSFLANRERT